MRFFSAPHRIKLSLVMLAASLIEVHAATAPSWQEIRDHQPAALHLKMTMARDHFFQGERIDATLDFSNDDATKPFSLWVGASVPGAVFHATDAKGNAVIDPLDWYYRYGMGFVGGSVGIHPLGQYSLTLPINSRLRFDQPGVYTVYAQANVIEGTSFTGSHRANLVSDPATITIDSLSPEKEKEIISGALKKIGDGVLKHNSLAREGVEELSFLQTPAARAQLIGFLGTPDLDYLAQDGLLSLPDPASAANSILTQVQSGKLVPTQEGAEIYSELKSSSLIHDSSPQNLSQEESQKLYQQLRNARDAARQEVLAAAIHAPSIHGPARIEALWAAFNDSAMHKNPGETDRDGGAARTALTERQLEMSPKDIDRLLESWSAWGSSDFLPLVKREAKAPHYNARALAAWAQFEPEKVAPLIGAEITSAHPKYFTDDDCYRWVKLPPEVLPHLTPYLREALKAKPAELARPLDFVGQYGTKEILPDLIALYHRTDWDQSTAAYGVNFHVLRYWIRWDPAGGVAALTDAMPKHDYIDRYQQLIEVLLDKWTPLAEPVVLQALESPHVQTVNSAAWLLVENADEKDAEPVVTATERIARSPAGEDPGMSSWRHSEVAYRAKHLLENTHWHWTADQQKRLHAIIALGPSPK